MTDSYRLRCNRCDYPRVKFEIHGRALCGQCFVWEDFDAPYKPTIMFGVKLTRRGEWVFGTLTALFGMVLFIAISALIGY